jgi:7-carboxy-7-deazaguanine synthase
MMTNTNFEYFMARVVDAVEIRSQDERIPEDNWQMVLKVVVFDEDDYQFARKLHIRWPLIPFYLSCGTAMGGLSGRWTPPTYGGDIMTMGPVIDNKEILLARYRWLAERMMNDPVMANVVGLPQLHALLFGITTRGV